MGISRREADEIIERGKVRINNDLDILGSRVEDGDIVTVNDKKLSSDTQYAYIALNKPVEYVCSRRQQGDTPTIYELLPAELRNLKTVGRLDKNSSGLILLTNDGDFAYQMTHPKFAKVKMYKLVLDKELEPSHQQMINGPGVELPDGVSKITLTKDPDNGARYWTATMKEGRNRQIRRTFGELGYEVVELHRIIFGDYALNDIKPGEYKYISIH